MAKRNRARWMALKIESVKGTAEALVAADAKIRAFDPDIVPDIEMEQRPASNMSGGQLKALPAGLKCTVSFSVEVKGSGSGTTLPLWASTALRASGFALAGSGFDAGLMAMKRSIADQATVTVGLWVDGLLKVASGVMFNVVFESDGPGKRVMAKFEGKGIWNAPTDASPPTGITYESAAPLQMKGATVTLATVASSLSKFTLDMGNDVQIRPGADTASGYSYAYIADMMPKLTIDPEIQTVASDDVYGDWLAGTEQALVIELGSATGNNIQFDAPAVQYINPRPGNREGLAIHDLECQLNNHGSVDDELTINFK